MTHRERQLEPTGHVLTARHGMVLAGEDSIISFSGPHEHLSNFWEAAIMDDDSMIWDSTEHLFQGSKTLDPEERERVRAASTPGRAKRMTKKVDFHVREDWHSVMERFMWDAITRKFIQHRELRRKLLSSGDKILVEGNTWHDDTWGGCYCPDHAHIPGRNLLGEQLMLLRGLLRSGKAPAALMVKER